MQIKVANRIQVEREALCLTQEELANSAGVPLSTLQKAERHARADHDVSFALKVSEALNADVADIFFFESSPVELKTLPTAQETSV